jgi:AraC-like DNA-binding protein
VIFLPDFLKQRFPVLFEQDEYQAFMHLEPVRRQASELHEFLKVSPKDLLEVNLLVEEIENEFGRQEVGYQTSSEAGIAKLLVKICRCFAADDRSESGTLVSIARVISRIRSQYDVALTLDELAVHSGMSKRSFIRHFTLNTGTTPMKFLTKTRMEEARRLLENTRYNVTEVAGRVGYDDPSHFSQVFRLSCRVTPLGYRKLYIKGLSVPNRSTLTSS